MRTVVLCILIAACSKKDGESGPASTGRGAAFFESFVAAMKAKDWPKWVSHFSKELIHPVREGIPKEAAGNPMVYEQMAAGAAELRVVEEREVTWHVYKWKNRLQMHLPRRVDFREWERTGEKKGVLLVLESPLGVRRHMKLLEEDGALKLDGFQAMFEMLDFVDNLAGEGQRLEAGPHDGRDEHRLARILLHEGGAVDASCANCGCRVTDIDTEKSYYCTVCGRRYLYDGSCTTSHPPLRKLRVEKRGDKRLVYRDLPAAK